MHTFAQFRTKWNNWDNWFTLKMAVVMVDWICVDLGKQKLNQ